MPKRPPTDDVRAYIATRVRMASLSLGGSMQLDAAQRRLMHEQPWGLFLLPLDPDIVPFANEYARNLTTPIGAGETDHEATDWSDRYGYTAPDGSTIAAELLPSVRALSGEVCEARLLGVLDRWRNESVWIYAGAAPVYGDDGSVIGSVGVSLITTDWYADRTWTSQTSVRSLMNHGPDAVAIVDRRMQYLACSAEWLRQPELNASDILGLSHEDVFRDPDVRWPEHRDRALGGEIVEERATAVPGPDGGVRYVQWRYVPWATPFGEVGGLILYRRDVTSTEQSKARLLRANRRLQLQNDALEQFAYAASHDLQEPLRAVHQFSDLLVRRYADAVDERGQRYLEHIAAGSQRMRGMIDGLLAFARAGDSADLVVVSLDAVVASVRAELALAIEENGATIIVHEPLPAVLGHVPTIESAVRNLLTNAMKYRRAETPLVVEIRASIDGEHVELQVSDNGRGFDPSHAERVFRLFRRLDNVGDTDGSGLGLAIIRRQLDAIGATIRASSDGATGATFTVRALRS